MLNNKTITLNLKRIEVCDLILACGIFAREKTNTVKWETLHDKLSEILHQWDEENAE